MHPGMSVAGSWYVSDFPPPQGEKIDRFSSRGQDYRVWRRRLTSRHDTNDIPPIHIRITDPSNVRIISHCSKITAASTRIDKLTLPATT